MKNTCVVRDIRKALPFPCCPVRVSKTRIYFTVPGEAQDVRASPINSTALHVTWKPPQEKDRNGIIRGYHVHVQEIKDEVRTTPKDEITSNTQHTLTRLHQLGKGSQRTDAL